MENKDLEYNHILNKLKNTEPILDDAGGLTDGIMQWVEQMPVNTGRIRMMRISGIMSGIAASALICLFVYETLKYPASPVEIYPETKWVAPVEKMYPRKITELSAKEKGKIIENVVKSKEAQQERKEQLYASFVVRNKIANSY